MFDELRPLRHAVVAIIEDGDEVLFIRRAEGDTYPGYWSGVTGSLEPGETQHQAITRETMEEVGLRVKPTRKLWESVTKGAHFILHWWQCRLDGPRDVTPDPTEVGDHKWIRLESIYELPVMFADSRHFFRDIYPVTRSDLDS